MHILIAEDDVPVAKYLSSGLEAEHYDVRIAAGGRQVGQLLEEKESNLVILDLNLPDISGIEVLRQIRAAKPHLPVLLLTGSARVEDRVAGLDSGADDCVTKPFSFAELSARVRALLRRSNRPFEPVLRSLDLELDRVQRTVTRSNRSVALTPKEFALLEYLMLNAGHCVSRPSILRDVWRLSSGTPTNVVDVYINYLRKKVELDSTEVLIHTVRGAGYCFGPRPKTAS
jgi:two-component system, OmpR family, copper resistance phosphate regulon response regulator CusR